MFNYEAKIENAKKIIKEADYILIGAGAGLSTAAGLEYSGDKFKNSFGYFYTSWIKDNTGKQYYVFIVKWLVEDHWSYINTVCVCTDGKTCKEIGSPESYTNGQLVTSFDSEGNF